MISTINIACSHKLLSDRNWHMQACSQMGSMNFMLPIWAQASLKSTCLSASHHASTVNRALSAWKYLSTVEILSRSVQIALQLFVYQLVISSSAMTTTIIIFKTNMIFMINQYLHSCESDHHYTNSGGRPDVSETDRWCTGLVCPQKSSNNQKRCYRCHFWNQCDLIITVHWEDPICQRMMSRMLAADSERKLEIQKFKWWKPIISTIMWIVNQYWKLEV